MGVDIQVIDTDRPHQTDTPHLIPAGHVQIEMGVIGVIDRRLIAFDDAYKYAPLAWLELDVLHDHVDYDHGLQLDPLTVRAKLRLVAEADGTRPAVSAVPTLAIAFSGPRVARAGLGMFFGWELPDEIELEADVGAFRDHHEGAAADAAWLAATALTVPIGWRVHGYGEVYIYGPVDDAVVTLGTGLLRPIGRDLQVDLAFADGVTGSAAVTQLVAGFSARW